MNQKLQKLITQSDGKKRLRVWSVILTFFGDAILPVGGRVSANTVTKLMAEMGIENGAVRTAFSRLTKDEWVTREKHGRQSFYELAPKGRKPFKLASDKIYASPNQQNKTRLEWLIATNPEGDSKRFKRLVQDFNGVALDGSTAIFNSDLPDLETTLFKADFLFAKSTSKNIPKWLIKQPAMKAYKRELADFISTFSNLPHILSPIEAMAFRCILIHEWRRLVLKLPDLPVNLLPPDWPAEEATRLVARHYAQLRPASQEWLEEEFIDTFGKIRYVEDISMRFNTLQK